MISTVIVAFSMFSAIPMPQTEWTNKSMRYALCAFPLIGAVIGALVCLWRFVCLRMEFSEWILAAGICVLPVLVTGGIHLDGFCDTADALYSRRPQEEKLRILKDPNCGPFAVFSVILVLLVSFGSYVQLYQTQGRNVVWLLAGGFLLTRCLSGIAVTTLPVAPTSSLVKTFGENAGKYVRVLLLIEYGITGLLLVWFWGWLAVVLVWLGLFVFWGCSHMAKKQFGGITGDLAGFFLVLSETVYLLGAALLGGVLA